MKRLMTVFAAGLALAAVFMLSEAHPWKTAHAQSSDVPLTFTEIGVRANPNPYGAILTWYGNPGEVYVIYQNGRRVAIQRYFQSSARFCVHGDTYYRHVTSSQGGYTLYKINIPDSAIAYWEYDNARYDNA